jgi:hypothetical protein
MNLFIKLNNGKAELRQTNGNLIRFLGNSDVAFADLNGKQDFVLLTTTSGRVELRQVGSNNLIRNMGNNDAAEARWNGDEIMIRTKSGKMELRSLSNNLIRTF